MKRTHWTPEMDSMLRRLYTHRSAAECALEIGVSAAAICGRVTVLGLHKPRSWMADRARQRWAEGRHTASHRHFSLRSTADGLDVATLAATYGGGGHARAAGFRVDRAHELARA